MIEKFVKEMAALNLGDSPAAGELAEVGRLLQGLARSIDWDASQIRYANRNEELLYPLHVAPGQPALYLVSDGPGVTSAPHGHGTWAVIVGLSGNELNTLYERGPGASASVRALRHIAVTTHDVLCLPATAIHATRAMDDVPTFHLHLYGKPLTELAPYSTRCYPTLHPVTP